VLNAKGDSNNGDKAGQSRSNVTNGKPDAGEDEPENVANRTQWTGANVLYPGNGATADGLLAKRQEGKLPDDKAGLGPRKSNNGDGAQQSRQPPTEAHIKTSEDKPQDITDCSHYFNSLRLLLASALEEFNDQMNEKSYDQEPFHK
jgi:hypothetical protein